MQFVPFNDIYLCHDVDIDVSYNHQYYWFADKTEQKNFFMGKVFKTLTNGSYQRRNVGVIEFPEFIENIMQAKYLFWSNADGSRTYYAFVTKIDYVNPSVSRIYYEIDVFQTYYFDMEWKQSYIERRHCNRWTTDETGLIELPAVNVEDEDIDYGTDYRIVSREIISQYPDLSFLVIATKRDLTSNTNAVGSTRINSIPTVFSYYILPIYYHEGKQYGIYINDTAISSPVTLLTALSTDEDFVNSCVSITLIPYLPVDSLQVEVDHSNLDVKISCSDLETKVNSAKNLTLCQVSSNYYMKPYEVTETPQGETKYRDFPSYEETKLYMYPYSFCELTDDRGHAIPVKLEYINGARITIGIFGTISYISKYAYLVKDYLGEGYFMEHGVQDNTLNEIPVIDDYTASYIQSNKNSIQAAKNNAQASLDVALANNSSTKVTGLANAERTYKLNVAGSGLKAIGDLISNPLGFASVAGNFANQYASALATKEASTANTTTNYLNTSRSARTSYQNEIRTLNAKIADIQAIPPTVANMGGEYLFNVAYLCDGVYLLRKTVTEEVAERLTNYFKQFGYKVNRVEQPNFNYRQNFDYIKMAEPNLSGDIPMDDLAKLRDIFMDGITLWHGDYIGDYSKANGEVE